MYIYWYTKTAAAGKSLGKLGYTKPAKIEERWIGVLQITYIEKSDL